MSQMQDILKALEETELKEKELEVRTKVLQKQNREMEETRAHVLRHKQELSEKRSLLLTLESQLEDVSVEKEILELRIRVRKQILDERVRRLQEPDEARENLLSLQKRKVELQRSFRKEADDYAATQAALGNLVDSYARVKEEAEEKFRQGSERKVKKEKLTRQIELLRSNLAETEATLKVKQLAIDTMHMDEDKNPEQLTETEASLMREIEELDKEIAGMQFYSSVLLIYRIKSAFGK